MGNQFLYFTFHNCFISLLVKFKFCELFAYQNYIPMAQRNQATASTHFHRPSISGFWPMIEVAAEIREKSEGRVQTRP
jgi:hypothetical protein